ncbi:MAG: GTP-binding protein [Planctomycetota bacterium]
MIPLALVTGFLGSGKTTFLQRVVERNRRRIVCLVNEFSSCDVDGVRLRAAGAAVQTLPGGSIFCRCLVAEFIDALEKLPQRFGAAGPVEGVVVEASGMSDPRVVPALLRETRLDKLYGLSSICAVVDPKSFLKLIHTLPAILSQVQAADQVLVNKTDLASAEEIAAAENAIREVSPRARILRTCRCAVDVELFGPAPERGLSGELAACVDPDYARLALRFSGDTDVADLQRRIMGLGDDVYRAKGFVPAGGRLLSFDYSAGGLEVGGNPPAKAQAELVFIVKGTAQARVAQALSATESTEKGAEFGV